MRSRTARSRQLHKCIVGGAAHAVFNGKIMVRAGRAADRLVAASRNLLLGAKAHVDTKPQLEIFADDVKCAHGATVGQLDADAVFYLHEPRPRRRRRAQPADLRVRRRDHRPHPGRLAPAAARGDACSRRPTTVRT